jgi:hypothetical protein
MVSSVRRRLVLFMSFTSVSTVKENYINVKHCESPTPDPGCHHGQYPLNYKNPWISTLSKH